VTLSQVWALLILFSPLQHPWKKERDAIDFFCTENHKGFWFLNQYLKAQVLTKHGAKQYGDDEE
jgi:hypothetical protein